MSESKKERAARKRQLEDKLGPAKEKKRKKQSKAATPSSIHKQCPQCASQQAVPSAASPSKELDLDQLAEEYIKKTFNWDELVRIHGEEGAAIIADCM